MADETTPPTVAPALSPPGAGAAVAPVAGRSRRAWALLLVLVAAALAVDLASKHLAFARVAGVPVAVVREEVLAAREMHPRGLSALIPAHEPVVVVPGVLNFTLVLNPGAVFGMGAGKRMFFIAVTGLVVVFLAVTFARYTRATDRAAHVGIGLLVAGGLGNLYDRVVYACVRDFLHPLPGWKFPFGLNPFGGDGAVWPYVSNVADLYLIVGVVLLGWYLIRSEHARAAAR